MFIGRSIELGKLTALTSAPSSIAVVYGRRRIGKSELLKEAFKNNKVFFFEGLENRSTRVQLKNFGTQISEYSGQPAAVPESWHAALTQLNSLLDREQHCVVVFDEFQWMANYRSEVVSELKLFWDRYWSKLKSRMVLVLCGSIASFMIKGVVRSKALYGRTDTVIHLQPLMLSEIREFLPQLGIEELFLTMFVFGGVPKYLELIKNEPSIILAIQKLAYTADSYFQHEYERIFVSHFGAKRQYQEIVRLLAAHHAGLTRIQISKLTGYSPGGRLSDKLFDLESAGFIRSYAPFNRKLGGAYTRYILSDPYLRFYFAFIEPNLEKSRNQKDVFRGIAQSSAFQSWLGFAFEHWCLDHRALLASILEFAAVDYTAGPYWGRRQDKSFQIDLILDRADNVVTLCEAKYRSILAASPLIQEVEKKVEFLRPEIGSKTIQKVLITKSEPSPTLHDYFFRILTCKQLVEHATALKL